MDRSCPSSGPRSPTNHSRGPSRSSGQGGPRERAPCQRRCADPARLRGAAGWGEWLTEAALPGICDVQGGRQQHGPWQHPRKPLIFLTLTVIRAAQRSERGGRCGVLPAARSPAGARRGCGGTLSERSAHIYRSPGLCVPSRSVRTWSRSHLGLSGDGTGRLEPPRPVKRAFRGLPWGGGGTLSGQGGEVSQSGLGDEPTHFQGLGHGVRPTNEPFVEHLLRASHTSSPLGSGSSTPVGP